MIIMDVLKELTDDALVDVDKIGSANYYWCVGKGTPILTQFVCVAPCSPGEHFVQFTRALS